MVTSGLRQASEGVKEYLIDQGQYSTSPTVHEVPSVSISPYINQSFFGPYSNQSFFGPYIIQSFSCESHLDDVSAPIVLQTLKVSKECSIDAENVPLMQKVYKEGFHVFLNVKWELHSGASLYIHITCSRYMITYGIQYKPIMELHKGF